MYYILIRMNSSFLRISSAERLNKNDPVSNFTVSIGNDANLQKITMIAVKEVTIPNTQYNINATNNVLRLEYIEGNVIETVVPPGQYDITSLITYINSQIGFAMTLAQDPNTKKIKATHAGGLDYYFVKTNNSINTVLGLNILAGEHFNISYDGGTVFPNLPDLTSGIARNFYVSSNTLSDGNSMISPTLPKMGIIAVVPNTANFGSITYYNSNEQKLDEIYYPSQIHGKNLTSIDLQLRNIDGSYVDLNGLDWSILIKVYYN